jgi:GNAT superfamily N-acetyltransferase
MIAHITIRQMRERDIDEIVHTFASWHKERPQYERYHAEQRHGERVVLVALHEEEIVGYGTVVWESGYEPFRESGIPEIVDLNVINEYQKRGIGTELICALERVVAKRSKTVGISVEQSPAYAAANRLYTKLGYIPDGMGITTHDNELHLIKGL